jgi:hypothetical protein
MRRARFQERARTAGSGLAVSVLTRLGSLVCVVALVGCYTLQPTGGAVPEVGKVIGLEINDAGRVALGGAMGPSIGQIEGRLVQKDNSEYVVAVTAVHLLRGGEQVWRGEAVHIKSEFVSSVSERRFSKSRSAILAAVGVGAIAIIASRSLLGLGDQDPGKQPGDTSQTQRRPRP